MNEFLMMLSPVCIFIILILILNQPSCVSTKTMSVILRQINNELIKTNSKIEELEKEIKILKEVKND